jgi:pyruvate dehydrogenase E2 component (dihydrolipoamide acetyltransferase)
MTTTEIVLPDLGRGVSSGELVAWLVEPGDRVAADQTIAEVETDKSLVEVPVPGPGVVAELRADPGTTVGEGDVVAAVDLDEGAAGSGAADDESGDESAAGDARAAGESAAGDRVQATGEPAGATESDEQTATSQGAEPTVASERVFAPPRVRRLARELGVDIATVEGTGDGGAVTESDVRAAAEKRSAGSSEQSGPREFTGGTAATARREAAESDEDAGTEPSTGPTADRESVPEPRNPSATKPAVVRREDGAEPLAERVERGPAVESASESATGTTADPVSEPAPGTLSASGSVPPETAGAQTTHYDDVDVTAMRAARERLAAAGVADGAISDLAFAVGAVASALSAVPELNGPIEDGEIDRRERINVAIAVPTDDGLIAPVVVDADDVGLPALAREIAELVDRAEDGSLSPAETADGTFTVTDFGALGGTYATPSVEAAGTAVLALGEVRERPRVHDGEVTPRAVLPLSAAVDSRAVDGAAAAQFLTEVRRYLTTPELILLE